MNIELYKYTFYVEWKHATGGMGGTEKNMIKKYIFIAYTFIHRRVL